MSSGSYTPTQKLRETAQAVLFRGHRNEDQAPVLLKIPFGDRPTPLQIAQLRHEYAILKALDVPGVVKPLGLEKLGDRVALVLEDPGERWLDTVVGKTALDLRSFLGLAISIARVLEAVHRKQIIHKDIRPHHFVVTTKGDVVLTDCAVATRLAVEDRRALGGKRLEGTLAYMSPEQTGRMNRVLDRRTDLYSLGVTLYELLTGSLPFNAADPLELVHSHIALTPRAPCSVSPNTPRVLSDIVMKLLAKGAEDRYQDVAGLRADLERCRELLDPLGNIPPFTLGEHDFSDELRIPPKLYGRESEAALLADAAARTAAGAAELVLLSGYSGTGKSALVGELQKHVGKGTRFVAGKFDQLGRRIPFAPFSQACAELVRSILAEPPDVLATYRQRILDAVGSNGQVVIDLVPELAMVIGAQPKAAEVGASEAQNRFELAFRSFFEVFTTREHPLVLFLDDLQWADAASLRLLHQLLTSPRCGHLLVVCAFRENEIDPIHPLPAALADLRAAEVTTTTLTLAPLTKVHVAALLADTFAQSGPAIDTLADVVLRKTHGNPFFLTQFLTTLHKESVVSFDAAERRWRWNVERIERTMVTANVVDFMVEKLRKLSAASQRVARVAACIGPEFDAQTVVDVSGASSTEVHASLWELLRNGLVVPSEGSLFLEDGDGVPLPETPGERVNVSFRFLHDRVQQAAYALVDEAERNALHLRVGRALMIANPEPSDDRLFQIVNHMNLGTRLIEDAGERATLAGLNLAAGRKARDAAAHAAAIKLLGASLDLLGENGWENDFDTAYAATLMKAECEAVNAHTDEAFRLLDELEKRARTTLERVEPRSLRSQILTNMNRLDDAIACSFETVRMLGMDVPTSPEEIARLAPIEVQSIDKAFDERSIESLADLPEMTDPERVALIDVLHHLIPAVTQRNPLLRSILVARALKVTLEHGNAPASAYFYVGYGMQCAAFGRTDRAYRFGELGLTLADRRAHGPVAGGCHFVFAAFVAFWRRHPSVSFEHLRRSMTASLETGDYLHATYCAGFRTLYRLFAGDSLDEIASELPGFDDFVGRSADMVNKHVLASCRRLIARLKGQASSETGRRHNEADTAELEAKLNASRNRYLLSSYYLLRAIGRYFAGELDEAMADLASATPPVPGNFVGPEIRFYRGVTIAARLRRDSSLASDARAAAIEELEREATTFAKWAEEGPETFGHRHAILSAELAAARGDDRTALSSFEHAIALAAEHGAILHEALANELSAALARSRGWSKIARAYARDAYAAYQRWGATTKAEELAPYAGLAASGGQANDVGVEQLDILTVVKASQAISTEIVLQKLIASLMRIVIEQAGAERGYLVLVRDGHLWVEGQAAAKTEQRFERFRLEAEGLRLPQSIVEYVRRTKEKVLLADAEQRGPFASDPYLALHQPRSVLCLPMIRQGSLVGVLYLENRLTAGVFSPHRVGLLEVLASQAAISVENAALYDEMERRVRDRTRELEATLKVVQENQEQLIEVERKMAVAHYEREMAIATQIQTSILPKLLHVPGYEISASMVPASEVGGDYYDLLPTKDGGFWIGIGDVSGHGLNAGLVMLMIQSGLASLMHRDPDADPASLVSLLNQMLYENVRVRLGRDDFATLSLLRFHPDGRFVFAGAHEEIIIWRASRRWYELVPTEGTWLGVTDHAGRHMTNRELHLAPGDVALLYTDGITEARAPDRRQFGVERLAEVLQRTNTAPTSRICREALEAVRTFTQPATQDDDQTLIVLRREGRPG
jgi:predicted ATPase/serine phosphatase RsbU (regulator of sigma subunit)